MKNIKNTALILSVLIMSFLIGYLAFAWQDPTAPPPGDNVSAPLNVGNIGQSKLGGLILNTGGAATGLLVQHGNVGIRTTSPDAFLHIQDAGAAAGARFLQIGDDTFLSDIDVANTLSIRGIQNSAIATLELGSGGARISGGSTGNVGIGTTAPGYKLDVSGTGRFTGALYANSNLYVSGIQQISKNAHPAGANAYHLELVSPDTGSASNEVSLRFHQGNRYWYQIRARAGGFRFTDGSSDTLTTVSVGNLCLGTDCRTTWPGGSGFTGSGTTNYVAKFTGATALGNSIIFDNGTNVGIGTTSPTRTLHVNSPDGWGARFTTPSGYIEFGPANIGGAHIYTDRPQFYLNKPINIVHNPSRITAYSDYPMHFNVGGSDRMVILSNGNVGIGTTSPASRLHVAGSGSDINFRVGGRMRVEGANAGLWVDAGGDDWFIGRSGGNLRFWRGSDRVTFTPDGNVGIGMTAPTSRLHIVGTYTGTDSTQLLVQGSANNHANITAKSSSASYVSQIAFTNGSNSRIWSLSSRNLFDGPNNRLSIYYYDGASWNQPFVVLPNGNVGIGIVNPASYKLHVNGTMYATSYECASDLNLKKDIVFLNGQTAIEKLKQINGAYFKWKEGDDKLRLGVIAQEVEKVFPEAVTTDTETGIKAVDYDSLIAPLIEAVKNQDEEIAELNEEVDELKRIIQELIKQD